MMDVKEIRQEDVDEPCVGDVQYAFWENRA